MKQTIRTFNRHPLAYSIATALVLSATSVGAATDAETLDTVVVWGTEVASSSVKLDNESMAIKQADHVSDLLRAVPGVDVGGAHSLNQRITIRGMDDKDLKISIDGANQNTYMYHHMGNLQIHADILKSVDIEVGNNSVVNGGLGGSVRFETKTARELLKPGNTFGARIQGTASSNAGNSVAVTGYGLLGEQVDFLAYYNRVNRDNYSVGGDQIRDQNGNTVAGTDGEVKGLEGELDDALLKFGWDINEAHRLTFGYESYKDAGDYSYRPDMGLATDLAIANALNIPLTYPTEFTRDTLTLNYNGIIGENTELRGSIFKNVSELDRDESGLASWRAAAAGQVTGKATNTGLNIIAVTDINAFGQHGLTYGLDYVKYKTDYQFSQSNSSNRKSADEQLKNTAVFIEDRWQVGGGVTLIPGIRHEIHDIDSAVVADKFSETTAGFGAQYDVNSHLMLHGSSTQLFKGPEIGETFTGAGLSDVPNNAIKAETGLNSEIGFAYENALFGAERFSIGMTWFKTEINDYIYDNAPHPSDNISSWKDNIGDLDVKGYEFYTGYDIGNLAALLSYSSSDSEINAFDEYAALNGARLDRQQGDTFTFSLDYSVSAADITLHWDYMNVDDVADQSPSHVLDGASSDTDKAGYELHNVSARWQPQNAFNGLSVTLGVDNLFDEYYVSQSSRTGVSSHPLFGSLYLMDYEPGRNIKMTVAYDF